MSFGSGVNSVALAIMVVNDGWRGDIVFSDTGCEWPETYCYMDYFEREWLQPRNLSITRLVGLPWHRKRKGLSLINYCEAQQVIPLAAVRWCTVEWKVKPLERFCKERGHMIGIALDEAHRKTEAIRPLVNAGIDRKACVEIIEHEGLNVPQKSGCYICPFMSNHQWHTLWKRHPALFDRAMQLEINTMRTQTGRWRATLDPNGKISLQQRKLAFESQMELPGMDMDELLKYKPCICTL